VKSKALSTQQKTYLSEVQGLTNSPARHIHLAISLFPLIYSATCPTSAILIAKCNIQVIKLQHENEPCASPPYIMYYGRAKYREPGT